MSIAWFPIGLALPTAIGWFALRLLEGNHPVLQPLERWLTSSVLGVTLSMFLMSISNVVIGVPYTLLGFLAVQGLICLLLGGVWFRQKNSFTTLAPTLANSEPLTEKWQYIVRIGMAWVGVKLLAAASLLMGPGYFDDTLNNWNYRAKVFLEHGSYFLDGSNGVSYPPTVPLFKTWLATLNGGWHEPLANTVHVWWGLALLLLVYMFLRYSLPKAWAAFGVYLLASMPLYIVHSGSAYADIFLAAHGFIAITLLYRSTTATNAQSAFSALRLAALSMGLLCLTKNEALVLHLPLLLTCSAVAIYLAQKRFTLSTKQCQYWFFMLGALISLIVVPWLAFKWSQGLVFGNAKSAASIGWAWHPAALRAIAVSLFLEANWLLLFPIVIPLVVWQRKHILQSPLSLLLLYAMGLLVMQIAIFVCTGLGTEAIYQTGYARGVLQILPVIIVLSVFSIKNIFSKSL